MTPPQIKETQVISNSVWPFEATSFHWRLKTSTGIGKPPSNRTSPICRCIAKRRRPQKSNSNTAELCLHGTERILFDVFLECTTMQCWQSMTKQSICSRFTLRYWPVRISWLASCAIRPQPWHMSLGPGRSAVSCSDARHPIDHFEEYRDISHFESHDHSENTSLTLRSHDFSVWDNFNKNDLIMKWWSQVSLRPF